MEKLISTKRYLSDPIARSLLEAFDTRSSEMSLSEAVFYYDFPSFRDYEDDTCRPNALVLSPNHGIIALNFCDSENTKGGGGAVVTADETLSQFFSILFGRLIKSKLLRRGRNELAFAFNAVIYSPGLTEPLKNSLQSRVENTISNSFQGLSELMRLWLVVPAIDKDVISEARSIIEGAKAMTRPKPREIPSGDKAPKAHILASLEAEIANFDAEQRKAAITLLSGPQRIRGLAGTGKTIVLAMKAAQLHLEDPTKRILYTFYTKSLYDLIKRLITRFYRHYKDSDPNWEQIKILHAWGGSSLPGVYYTACMENGVSPLRWQDVSNNSDPFGSICADLLKRAEIKSAYDCILIDEGQDMPEDFFRLCFHLTPGDRDSKNIVWAYDELQNIFDVKVRSPHELFGKDNAGEPLIDLERASSKLPSYLSNDSILYKSYRNPKEVLIAAHALGFALYSDQIVQMLENREHWEDIGYEVLKGEFRKGSPTVILRPDANSPLTISKYETKNKVIQHFAAPDLKKEIDWIVEQIIAFLGDGLRPEDILVISLDDRNARRYFDDIRAALITKNIVCNNVLDNPYTSSRFAVDGMVTLSTVHRAKGNEAAAVIAIGIDALYQLRKSRTGRNRIFAAFTRTKAWLRVSGVGENADYFLKELTTAVEKCPKLEFSFPDLRQVNMLHRDMSKREAKLLSLREKYRKDLQRLGLAEEDMAEFFMGNEKK